MALHGKKGFSASQTKRTSRRMNGSMIGSHVERPSVKRGRHSAERGDAGTNRVDFSDSHRSRRATRGYVDQIDPGATSGESDADFARRSSRRGYAEQIQSTARKKRVATGAMVAIVVAAIAVAAGIGAFFAFSDARLSLGDSNAREALVAPAEGEAYFALCTAQLGSSGEQDEAYMAVRIDEAARTLTFVTVPSQISVEMSDGERHTLAEAASVGGDAELIRQVSQLLGVDIAHFASTDAAGIRRLVDLVGGVPVNLAVEVDDPRAGTNVLAAGEQTLDGSQALTLLRATNFTDGLTTQATNRAMFTVNLAGRATSGEGLSFPSVVSDAAPSVSTDWTSGQIIALGDALRPLSDAVVYAGVVPGHLTEDENGSVYRVDDDELASMMDAVRAGNAPQNAEGSIANVNRALITVDVRNGAQVTGAAKRMGELLESAGYQVKYVGNTDDNTTYPETLVIYKDAAYEVAAKAIVSDLAAGRVVNGGDFYTFDTDVLVIIGKDWIPAGS
ncbi:LCP family protein [Adlercreutzia sp. R21]|uniref:LCP family protein n=1 Tax=Adlercreutzia wanghongyangiae TaxID=3111451 RepID=A0ABU6IJJ7_9ACTN|nr:LCP family protein [Adlercreutzia sp. R21]MEC4176639.1 LCP family protein [Adlercreutzia sp. R7]MEC4184908.1 LCP family protein [Adlercreutzia sp. R21]